MLTLIVHSNTVEHFDSDRAEFHWWERCNSPYYQSALPRFTSSIFVNFFYLYTPEAREEWLARPSLPSYMNTVQRGITLPHISTSTTAFQSAYEPHSFYRSRFGLNFYHLRTPLLQLGTIRTRHYRSGTSENIFLAFIPPHQLVYPNPSSLKDSIQPRNAWSHFDRIRIFLSRIPPPCTTSHPVHHTPHSHCGSGYLVPIVNLHPCTTTLPSLTVHHVPGVEEEVGHEHPVHHHAAEQHHCKKIFEESNLEITPCIGVLIAHHTTALPYLFRLFRLFGNYTTPLRPHRASC